MLLALACVVLLLGCKKGDSSSTAPTAADAGDVIANPDTGDTSDPDVDAPGPNPECVGDDDCADGDPCNGQENCQDGKCAPGTAVDCAALDTPCAEGVCDPGTGGCETHDRADDTPCDDGHICTTDDACAAGVCGGAPLDCDDGMDCSVDSCEQSAGGCTHDMLQCPCVTDDECDDGNACNGQETCATALATCSAGDYVDCSELDDGCTQGICDAQTGACAPAPLVSGTPCDDGQLCTESDSCQEGTCLGAPVPCDDGKACSVDICEEDLGGCVFDSAACQCTTDADCDDANVCNGAEVCDAISQACKAGGSLTCDDGLFCNGSESCDPSQGCLDGSSPETDDGDPCTLDVCDEDSDVITHEPDPACDALSDCPDGPGVYCGAVLNLEPDALYTCSDGEVQLLVFCAAGCTVLPLGTDDVCAAAYCPNGPGTYCGSGVGLDPATLYTCQDGAFSVTEICGGGCQVEAAGVPDACAPASCPYGDGPYCGSGVGLDPDVLYWCDDGNYVVMEVCAAGCEEQAPGIWDTCVQLNCPFGDGLYCGTDEGLDPDALYQCDAGHYTLELLCISGCEDGGDGSPDACVSAACPYGPGEYCGESVGLDEGVLYHCDYGGYIPIQTCAVGCQDNGPGIPDICVEPTCPFGPGTYCGGPLGMDPGALYWCEAGSYSLWANCSEGCDANGSGVSDSCVPGDCPYGSGDYCGESVELMPEVLFTCDQGIYTIKEVCAGTCVVAEPGYADYCTAP